jgi:hypothetical protein
VLFSSHFAREILGLAGIPDAISVEDNERGSESSLTHLAKLLEGR